MVMTNPYFWKWSEWVSLWPRPPAGISPVFDVSGTSDEFQTNWHTTARLLAICNGAPGFHEPVSLQWARQVATAMDNWVDGPVFADLMTLPPTRRGFRAALAVEFRRSSPSLVTFVLALTRPSDIAAILESQADARLSKDWQIVKACIQHPVEETTIAASAPSLPTEKVVPVTSVKPASPVAASAPAVWPASVDTEADPIVQDVVAPVPPQIIANSSTKTPTPSVVETRAQSSNEKIDRIPNTDKQRPTPSAAVQNCALAMASWVDNAVGQNPSVAREEIGKEIKAATLATKGAGMGALNYWFEDVGFPSLCTLPPETAKSLVSLWPDSVACTFNDPIRAMDNLAFWRAIRFTQSKAMRIFIVDEALPRLIRSDWDAAMRLAMLDPMTAAAREPNRGWLFEERLRLWKAFGGRLDAPVALEPDPGASFLSGGPRSTTARKWLESQKNSNWMSVIAREPLDSRPDERDSLIVSSPSPAAAVGDAPFDFPDEPTPPRRRGP
jgi:hypothetical protein